MAFFRLRPQCPCDAGQGSRCTTQVRGVSQFRTRFHFPPLPAAPAPHHRCTPVRGPRSPVALAHTPDGFLPSWVRSSVGKMLRQLVSQSGHAGLDHVQRVPKLVAPARAGDSRQKGGCRRTRAPPRADAPHVCTRTHLPPCGVEQPGATTQTPPLPRHRPPQPPPPPLPQPRPRPLLSSPHPSHCTRPPERSVGRNFAHTNTHTNTPQAARRGRTRSPAPSGGTCWRPAAAPASGAVAAAPRARRPGTARQPRQAPPLQPPRQRRCCGCTAPACGPCGFPQTRCRSRCAPPRAAWATPARSRSAARRRRGRRRGWGRRGESAGTSEGGYRKAWWWW